MWFDPTVRKLITSSFLVGLTITVALIVQATAAFGADAPSFALPEGERLLQLAWSDDDHLVLIVDTAEGFAVRWLEVSSGELAVIPVPRSFSRIENSAEEDLAVEFYLAPSATALAVLERTINPLIVNELSVYSFSPSGLEVVDTHRIPGDFWPGLVAWDPQGLFLYLAAVPFINPDQGYSIGRLEISTGNFENLELKANLDLIEQLVYIPQRHALAVNCRSFHGEYPQVAMVVLIETGATATILHSQATGFRLLALANGQLYVQAAPDVPAGLKGQRWVLALGADALRRIEDSAGDSSRQIQSSPRGTWLGYLVPGSEVGLPGADSKMYLALNEPASGAGFSTTEPCEAFSFAPSEMTVCTVGAGGNSLHFYNLPE